MKKNLIMILVGSIVAFAVVGCSAPAEGNTEGTTTTPVEGSTVKPADKADATTSEATATNVTEPSKSPKLDSK